MINYKKAMEYIIERELTSDEFVIIFATECNRQLYYSGFPYLTVTEGQDGTCYIITKNTTGIIVNFQDLQDAWLEIEPELSRTEKRNKLKQVRLQLLQKYSWVNTLYSVQDYGYSRGLQTGDRILTDELMDEWALWYKAMTNITNDWTDIYLDNLNIDDIDESLFPVNPECPDSIM